MDSRELTKTLTEYSKWNRAKCVPWWDADRENPMFRYSFLTWEEESAVEEAVENCNPEELSAAEEYMGLTPFHLLVWCGLKEAAECALKKGVEPDIPGTGACMGVTPLMAACSQGNEEMVRLLLDSGAGGGLTDAEGRNAWHYLAGARIHKELLPSMESRRHSLMQRRAITGLLSGDINAKDLEGLSPFEFLIRGESGDLSWALAEEYIRKGADVRILDQDGNSLLMRAVEKNHFAAALALMEADAGLVNLPNREGTTPLHLAAYYRIELCMALLDRKADKDAADGSGKTPRDVALERGDNDYRQLFTSGRVKLDTLSRFTANAFAGAGEEKDRLAMGLYLAGKLIREVDPDDDEEMGLLQGILYNALTGDEECRVLELMVKGGIDLTAPIHRGGSVECIRDSCLTGNAGVKAIRKLTELGMDMNEALIRGRTPANIVASKQERTMFGSKKDDYFEEAAKLFSRESMEQVDNGGTTAVHEAARWNHVEMLKVMIGKGVNVNLTQDAPADAGSTPLHLACAAGNGDAAALLMRSGADDTILNVKGETAAHLALTKRVFGGDMPLKDRVKVLDALEHVDIPGQGGWTPLMQMLRQLDLNAKTEILPLLLDKGVDVNRKDERGSTALMVAMDNQGHKGVARELVRAGADVNAENKNGSTALHLALRWGDQESAIFLIKKGADYNHADNAGVTPAQIAAEKGYDTVLDLMMNLE